MMSAVFAQACRELFRRPLALVAGMAGVVLLLALTWWWLSLPVAEAMDLILLAVIGLAAVALAGCMAWRAFRMWGAKPLKAMGRGAFWAAAVAAALTGLLLPWSLLNWVPGLDTLLAQAVSMLVRFGIAVVLFTASAMWLGAVAGILSRRGEGSDGEDVHTEEPEADPAA